jgi:CoA:oxalate CoA-transferase
MKVLDGIRVLDLSQFLSGPRAAQMLAFFGAEVIKIEPPQGDTMRMLMVVSGSERSLSTIHQNKKGMVIDLRQEEGKTVFLDLVEKSDVIVENFKPGTMEKLGLSWETLRARNPRLVYAAISGFGRTGPLSDRTAFDIISQATGGTMHGNGIPDRPPGVFFGDLGTGGHCALGIMAALMAREKSGKGQLVDLSMQDVMYFHNFWGFSEKATGPVKEEISAIFGRDMTQLLTDYEHPMPFWNSYKATDGHVVVVALTDGQWNGLMELIGRSDLIGDERFSDFVSRIKNADEGIAIVTAWMESRSSDEIVEKLTEKRIPCGKVANYDQLNQDPQLAARQMYQTVTHARLGSIDVPGNPVRLSDTPGGFDSPCPDLGEHTDQVLAEVLGLDEKRIESLRKSGAVM